jgi:hypothetical protein
VHGLLVIHTGRRDSLVSWLAILELSLYCRTDHAQCLDGPVIWPFLNITFTDPHRVRHMSEADDGQLRATANP